MKMYYQRIDGQQTFVDGTATLVNANVRSRILPYEGILNEDIVRNIITSYIRINALTPDEDAVYAIIFRGDYTFIAPDDSTWLGTWCGYHCSYQHPSGAMLKFFVAGDPSTAPGGGVGCNFKGDVPPNGSLGGDGLASIYAHELIEVVTDWNGDAWYFPDGFENADYCAWEFSNILPASSSLAANSANILVGEKYFLVQNTFVPPNLGCAMSAGEFSSSPTRKPTIRQSNNPTNNFNILPQRTDIPMTQFKTLISKVPNYKPSIPPSKAPSKKPFQASTLRPTKQSPTQSPTVSPKYPSTKSPTPSSQPTAKPFPVPTQFPSIKPIKSIPPTQTPTSRKPTCVPTLKAKSSIIPSQRTPTVKITSALSRSPSSKSKILLYK